jgi:uncharacterized protein (TIGR02757 family)
MSARSKSEKLSHSSLKDFLEEKTDLYNRPEFIQSDPVLIPHLFTSREDQEIAGFFAATFAWGQRTTILAKSKFLMKMMDDAPYDFVLNAGANDLRKIDKFVHRTFNGSDVRGFIYVLRKLYKKGGLYSLLKKYDNAFDRINALHDFFAAHLVETRTLRHVSSPEKGSAAKRINMYLRWMVRNDKRGVDLGLWKDLGASSLVCPLDVHSGNVARKLGLLSRTQNDWRAAIELTENLRKFDAKDPVKYDFALFGLGVFEKF